MQGVMPAPSGVDIANTIKYFSQTLLTVLKDVPNSPFDLLKDPDMDAVRMTLFPSLDYKGLYNSLIPLLEVAPLINYGILPFGQSMLQILGCLLPFLEHDLIDNLPYLTASSISVLPNNLHQEIINTLCFYILPFTISRHNDRDSDICQSVSAVIMMVFQYSTNPALHCQLLECLMTLKQNILRDILSVIAYGTSTARSSAAKLLFYYWPTFNANLFDRKNLICKFADPTPFVCQRDMCPNSGNAEAAKVCYDHCISITYASDTPPPLYLCIECANEIHREHPNQMFFDILHPMQQVSMVCENKNCRSTDKSAISICFSTECASYNGNHPIRYCEQCHNNRHNNRRGGDHIFHKSIPPTWNMEPEMQTYMVEAIVSLLKEAKIPQLESKEEKREGDKEGRESREGKEGKSPVPAIDNITIEERQLLGRYGVWLLVGRCTPTENTSVEVLGRLLAMIFHWFHMTALSYDGQEESTLEKLKTEIVCNWLRNISRSHYKLFISCLLPHPPEYARIGGHWDTLSSRTTHLKDGLNRLFCLVPYEVITQEIWNYVMPHWMEAIVNDVPEKELFELRIILSKILDTDMSPLGFNAKKMFQFVSFRFQKTSAKVQQQALQWLQTLTLLEIIIPLNLLFTIFGEGVSFMKEGIVESDGDPTTPHELEIPGRPEKEQKRGSIYEENRLSPQAEFETDAEHNLFCCLLMLDILLKQMELQDTDKHTGLNSSLCKDVCWLLKCMITAAWIGNHSCSLKSECTYCESSIMWHQLSLQLLKYLSPIHPAHPPDPPLEENYEDVHSRKSPPECDKKETKTDAVITMSIPEAHSVGGVIVHMPHIMTATVETVSEQLDLPIIPVERVPAGMARAITLSESDVAMAKAQIVKAQVIGENDEPVETDSGDDIDNFWQTSIGKFKFCVEELPQPLQYLNQLLQELSKVDKPDILYYMLQCLNVLILHGDACTIASKEHRGFFIWCQENLLIKNLWELCNSEHSHICQAVVPLLLHCITLPAGSDVFWRVIQEAFHSSNWCVRFTAVERVTVITRFMNSSPLRNVHQLQAALANAFCYLISSMDDSNVCVAQRATLYLGTIHDSAIKSLIMCLESQFDSVIVDRPMVLQSLYQLHNSLSERKIITWDFFLNRFDTLFIEAQITLEKSGEITYFRDLRNSDANSETLQRKIQRAHDALSQCDGSATSSIKTLSASFGTKWPYKRTMSAPASIITRHENKETKEKVYNRQYSAPILKRKSSRFGLDGHMHSLNMVDDQNITTFLQRVIDLEEADKETMHLLVFLLMQFLSRSDQAYPAEEKNLVKTQGIVLRHLYLLLGYSQNDRGLYLPPQRLRSSPAFSAFLSNLPQLMDQNHMMGRLLLPTYLILLQYAPSPHYIPNAMEFQQPTYSLWALESHFRKNWLMSLVVLLYKYQYNQQPHCMQLTSLIQIVLNTLDCQHHHCRRIPATIIMGQPPSRSRDVSQPSLGAEIEHTERATPPPSPIYSSDGQSIQAVSASRCGKIQVVYVKPSSTTSMETHWEEAIHCIHPEKISSKKHAEISMDDDTESELIVIPDSDMSDSTLQGSVQGSFDEGVNDSFCEKHIIKSPKETYINQLVKLPNKGRPTWTIGSEEDSSKSCDNKFYQEALRSHSELIKNCSRLNSSSSINGIQLAKTVTIDLHKQVTSTFVDTHHMGKPKHKKIIEPSITPVCTPVSDCEDCYKNNHTVLPTPSLERLLPIGSSRVSDSPLHDDVFSPILDSPLEIPSQERLLPIGQHPTPQLMEKLKQALGINTQIIKLDGNKKSDKLPESHTQGTSSHSHSPRKLTKQVALESPPTQSEFDENGHFKSIKIENQRDIMLNHRQRIRKVGPFAMNSYSLHEPRKPGTWLSPQMSPTFDGIDIKQSSFRIGDDCVTERCSECGLVKEEYSDEEIGLCIVTLGTFIHREPALAAPMLPDILSIVAKVATNVMYPWQTESNIHLPGGAISVAHQFLRCVLHQLAPNGIFTQMFQTNAPENIRMQFFKSVIQALIDFNELNPVAPLQLLLETLNSKKTLPVDILPTILQNMACYFNCLPLEVALGASTPMWGTVLQQVEILYRKLIFLLNTMEDVTPLLKIMSSLFKIPLISQFKGLLEPFSKVVSYAVQTQIIKYGCLMEICYLCYKAFTKERDKLILSRMVVFELVQALKFKTSIPDSNLLMLINLILQDIGSSIPSNVVIKDCSAAALEYGPVFTTGISECMKLNLGDILEFLTDFHAISKMKSYCRGVNVGLNDDTLGGIIKCSIAQYLALEITKGNGRDNRAVTRYFPWLCTSSMAQQSPREFIECIGHIRLLSWLLLGSLTHTALQGNNNCQISSQPIPQEASCQIADHIQIIMAGFAEQPKASILHMSSLFHTFILCQLWTIYLEQGLSNNVPITEAYNVTMNILFDFWGKVTPCILQLIQQSKMLCEIVSLHFLSMLEALLECQSTFVGKLLPLWTPVLCSNQLQLPGHLQVRLQNCRNFPPTVIQEAIPEKLKVVNLYNPMLLKWLQRLQFKMGQIELQSSTATQFYSL
ncbi:protein unc-79 homolog isoform X3 [Diorhabda carinulata]|uniref:protein unc-79 homolog isoform X3 n=1 Tax=Diorhabda carinulata TaxID=1163345 RepID=UPI0025A24D29|nr:protein unc-79 homolog isoform X3 [Diorhabda carinulata]